MAEMGDGGGGGGGTIDDWRGLLSSPRGNLFSGFLADGYASSKSFTDFDGTNLRVDDAGGGGGNGGAGLDAVMEGTNNWKPADGRNGASIAERRGVRCGFNAPRLNTARFRTTSPLSSPQYLTIPPGLSPTSLLDSPVMLSNSQALPSPTTGTFTLPSQSVEAMLSSTSNVDKHKDDDLHSSFMFKPHGDAMSLQYFSSMENQVSSASNQIQAAEMGDTNHQMAPTQVKFESQAELLNQTVTKSSSMVEGVVSVASEQAPQLEQSRPHDTDSPQLPEGDKRGPYPPVVTGRPSEDGYNWRKYGQKQVKGSEYPRSYYKCTHQNCQVKKKIERSHDGQITEIIYKGGHNHPQPQPSSRRSAPYSVGETWETGEDSGLYVKVEGGSAWRSAHQGSMDNVQERTSSTSAVTEASDHLSTAQEKHMGILDSADTPELSSTLASHDEEEDRATQGSISIGDEADDDESESKRRKRDSCITETSMASRAIREPRVVVQTHSEVDILDDGYRWRKYGQKVVKGNPNPRSYYKCTSAGCSVRKHVERASHDLKYVITTYEGKHNHEVPAARNSSHMNTAGGNAPSAISNSQASLTLPRGSTHIAKPEAQVQDLVPRFERKPDFSNEFFRNANLGRFASDMKLQPYQTSIIPCGTFGLNPHYNGGAHQAAHMAPDFAMSMPMNVPMSANLAFNGYHNLGNAVAPQSFVGNQQMNDADMRLVRPKQEQKDDSIFGSSASMLQQMMGGFPSQN